LKNACGKKYFDCCVIIQLKKNIWVAMKTGGFLKEEILMEKVSIRMICQLKIVRNFVWIINTLVFKISIISFFYQTS